MERAKAEQGRDAPGNGTHPDQQAEPRDSPGTKLNGAKLPARPGTPRANYGQIRRTIIRLSDTELSSNPLYYTPLFRAREAAQILKTSEDALSKVAKIRELGEERNSRRLYSVIDLRAYLLDRPRPGRKPFHYND